MPADIKFNPSFYKKMNAVRTTVPRVALRRMQQEAAESMRRNVPVRTGELKTSIVEDPIVGDTAVVRTTTSRGRRGEGYASIVNQRRGFRERAIQDVRRALPRIAAEVRQAVRKATRNIT